MKKKIAKGKIRGSWRECFGMWKGDKEIDMIFKKILKERHKKPVRKRIEW